MVMHWSASIRANATISALRSRAIFGPENHVVLSSLKLSIFPKGTKGIFPS